MAIPTILPCDGCGQLASAGHIERRLQRLEWATRFRPIHVQALLLAAEAPNSDAEFLYSPETRFSGIAGSILSALELPPEGRPAEEVLAEFQKRGLIFAAALECPVEHPAATPELLERHLPSAIARIRRSLKPKRVLLLSPEFQSFLPQLSESALGCPVFYAPLHSAPLSQCRQDNEIAAFRAALPALAAHGA
jgi:hypothetical protein